MRTPWLGRFVSAIILLGVLLSGGLLTTVSGASIPNNTSRPLSYLPLVIHLAAISPTRIAIPTLSPWTVTPTSTPTCTQLPTVPSTLPSGPTVTPTSTNTPIPTPPTNTPTA